MRFSRFRPRTTPSIREEISMTSEIPVINDSSLDSLITTSAEVTRIESAEALATSVEIDPDNLVETSAAAYRASQLAAPVIQE